MNQNVNVQYTVEDSEDNMHVPNSTYFHDIKEGVIKFKNYNGKIFFVDFLENTSFVRQIEVDFGSASYQSYKIFNVVDTTVTTSSLIMATKAIGATTDGRNIDEQFAQELDITSKAKNGSIDFYVRSLCGSINGNFLINYTR